MIKRLLAGLIFLLGIFSVSSTSAQDELPEFSVVNKGGGRIIISWKNKFETINQIAIQRSYDSLKRFTSIYSTPSPLLPENGYTDKVAPGVKVYYRIFYVLSGGNYFFTATKTPTMAEAPAAVINTKRDKVTEIFQEQMKIDKEVVKENVVIAPKKVFIKLGNEVYKTVVDGEFFAFRDSIMTNTKDTLFPLSADTIELRQYILPFEFKASVYVYTDKDGYITINLPEATTKKYDLIILEEDGTSVLELKNIKNNYLTLDKSNLYHAGWYKFELWENGKVKDRNKLFVPRDFSQ